MSNFLYSNYHAHTTRCQHAVGTEREYIEAAIGMGIKVFGFSDHVPCPFKDGYVSGIRMTMDQAPEYVDTIRSLAKEYRDDIRILVGFEAEYIPEFYEEQSLMAKTLKLDYMIMGQHFWTSESAGAYSGAPTRDEERIRNYVDSVIEGMETGSYLYLAHPDLIHYVGLDSVYEYEMGRLCREMKRLNIPLEINMLGCNEGRHYPNRKFWALAGEYGNDVILGLDAHQVANVTDTDAYYKCMDLVEEFGLSLKRELEI